MTKGTGEGLNRDELQGNLKDPTGLPPRPGERSKGNDQQMPKGAEGREGGSAGSRTGGGPKGDLDGSERNRQR
ncbi:MAG: hypothetical protein LC780_16745 [Acidobacteria bacterium]|nr:hypothetical protein [Acidobacteriota bacterium]